MTNETGPQALTPEAVAASLARGDGGFGREQQSYYDHPVLQKPHWSGLIEWYFLVGGLASGSALLGALGDLFGDERDRPLVRNGRYAALLGSALSGVLLIFDLGRPERFLNMFRIVKLKSPMSVGVYTLTGFSVFSGLAVLDELYRDGITKTDFAAPFPSWLRNLSLAVCSALLGSYTGVLVSATAIPVWFSGRRYIPAIFVCSATATACALNLALLALERGTSAATMQKLERLQMAAALGETALLRAYQRAAGPLGKPLFSGPIGRRLTTWTEIAGTVIPLALNLLPALGKPRDGSRRRARAVLAAGLTLAGGFVLRQSIVAAGRDSADDPRAYLYHKRPR